MNTRPNGLNTPMAPVTERDPATVLRDQAREIADSTIAWAPGGTDYQLAQYRQELELDRDARNRNARPAPLRVPGGVL